MEAYYGYGLLKDIRMCDLICGPSKPSTFRPSLLLLCRVKIPPLKDSAALRLQGMLPPSDFRLNKEGEKYYRRTKRHR